MKKHIIKNCLECKKEFSIYPSLAKKKFCSVTCAKRWQYKNGGRIYSDRNLSLGRINYTEERCKNIKKSHEGKPRLDMRGENNPNWQGGKSRYTRKEKWNLISSLEYKIWRRKVFERDNYTCQNCNIQSGNLNAHHIKPTILYPELIFNLDNGITLCVNCHLIETIKQNKSYPVNQFVNAYLGVNRK